MKRIWKNRKQLYAWAIAVFALLAGNMAAAEIKDYIDYLGGRRTPEGVTIRGLLAYAAVFLFSVYLLYRERKTLFFPQTRFVSTERNPPKKEHLVLFLSDLPEGAVGARWGVPDWIDLTGDLHRDLETLVMHKTKDPRNKNDPPKQWRWEMPLRAIRHHLGRLRTITLICSNKSLPQAHWFGHILRLTYGSSLKVIDTPLSGESWIRKLWRNLTQLFRKPVPPKFVDVVIRLWVKQDNKQLLIDCPTEARHEGGWDFENFDDLSQALIRLIVELKKEDPEERQIMIDFTGGQKITSVVAAAVTFNRPIKTQYVQTNPTWEVLGYDILLSSSLTEGVGL